MAANPRIVTEDRQIFWDGVQQRLPKGQQIDVPPGSALEREIGAQFLIPLPGSVAAQPPVEPVEAAEAVKPVEAVGSGGGGGGGAFAVTPVPPAKPRTAGKKQDDDKDGSP